ncbi:MAG TPA: GNAT family N-acetyltransferase [Natronosporangium sp.]|nr:GNAT family N-acetyltransferase [Natronosporangium sp.]
MLSEDDLGHRVVVRRVAGRRGDRPLFTDVLGELTAVTATELTVATDAGPVRVPRAAVVAGKRIPPRRAGRREVRDLEYAANDAWPAPEQERLGDWLLRAAGGWSRRANSALPVGDPGRPLPAAIDEVTRWYRARGLDPAVNVPLPLARRVDAELAARGWRRGPTVLTQTAPLAVLRSRLPDGGRVRLATTPDADWLALTRPGHHPPGGSGGEVPPVALRVLTGDGRIPVRFAYRYGEDGSLVAAARGTVTGNGRWFGLARLAVAPAARRRGLAREVIGALAAWAADLGATDAFLQVMEDNGAALALYDRLGFTTHHTYVSRSP